MNAEPRATMRVTRHVSPSPAGCALTLSHEGVLADDANRTETGWNGILDGLAAPAWLENRADATTRRGAGFRAYPLASRISRCR
jgi:hypothetical protein